MTNTTIILDDEFREQIRQYCDREGYSYSGLVVKLLRRELEENDEYI